MQTKGTYQTKLQMPGNKVLFAVWQGRSTYQGLSPDGGKRQTGRERRSRRITRPRISYTPRPHLHIRILGHNLLALLDSGSEVSFLSEETATLLGKERCRSAPSGEVIHLAEGTEVPVTETMRVLVRVQGKSYRHRFAILPRLGS